MSEPNNYQLPVAPRHTLVSDSAEASGSRPRVDSAWHPLLRDMASALLSALRPPPRPTLVEDIAAFSRAVSDIAKAAQDGVLTEAEAESLIRAVTANFAGRRVIDAVAAVGDPTPAAR